MRKLTKAQSGQCCGSCRWAQWMLTPTGRIASDYSAWCGYPLQKIKEALPEHPQAISIIVRHDSAVWPMDGKKCPCYECVTPETERSACGAK